MLAVKPLGFPGLVLAHWWIKLGTRVAGFGPKVLELMLACLWAGPSPRVFPAAVG